MVTIDDAEDDAEDPAEDAVGTSEERGIIVN